MTNQFAASQIEQLLSSTKIDKKSCKNFDLTLYTISYLLEDDTNGKTVIGYINKLLKSSLIDEEVYIYLTKILSSIPEEALFENIIFWMQRIVDNNRNDTNSKRYAVISTLIELGKDYQEFNKSMLSSLLFQILDECMSVDVENFHVHASLMCLATCLETYPTSCISKKKEIESYLTQFLFLKTLNSKLLKNAVLCFQKLQKIGPPGLNLINYSNNWKTSFEKLCVTLDNLYDVFFDDIDEFHKYEKLPLDPYILPDFPKIVSSTEMLYILENRLHNTCMFLRGMLENEFSSAKCIMPQYILNIIGRVLSLHLCVNKSTSDTKFHFSMILLKNQVDILFLLRSLIAVLKLNLLQFSAIISRLLVDCLTRTHHCNCFNCMGEYKETVYKVLEYWIKMLKNSLNINVHERVISLIMHDIASSAKQTSITITNTNDVSKKAKNKSIDAKIILSSAKCSDSGNRLRNSFQVKERICYQSLCCLSAMFNNVYLSLKEATFVSLYNALIKAILSICNGKTVFPFTTNRIVLKLFEALIALLEYSKPPASINLIINLLRGNKETTTGLPASVCTMNLNLLEKICQPICPSWNFIHINTTSSVNQRSEIKEIDVSDDFTNKEVKEQTLQERELEMLNNTGGHKENENQEIRSYTNAVFYSDISMEEQDPDENDQQDGIDVDEEDLLFISNDDDDANLKHNEEMFIDESQVQLSSDQCAEKINFGEPNCKKTKTSSGPDINEMLASFVDEVEMPDIGKEAGVKT